MNKEFRNVVMTYRGGIKCMIPGYHMNKKHWNTIIINGEMKDEILIDMIDDSYDLVVSKLTKKVRLENFLHL